MLVLKKNNNKTKRQKTKIIRGTGYTNITPDNVPKQLQETAITIEYESPTEPIGSSCFLFVIDTALTKEKEFDAILNNHHLNSLAL